MIGNFLATDGVELPFWLLSQDGARSKPVVIWLHGCGNHSIYYKQDQYNGIYEGLKDTHDLFAFNNRGATYYRRLRKFEEVDGQQVRSDCYAGTWAEKIEECVYDIDGAVEYLSGLGYTEFVLAGLSSGANKICVYDHLKQKNNEDNLISKYFLISGGDDVGLYHKFLGDQRFSELRELSLSKLSQDKGLDMIPSEYGVGGYTYQGFEDITNPDGFYNSFPFFQALGKNNLSKKDLFKEFKNLSKPATVVYEDNTDYMPGDASMQYIIDLLKNLNSKTSSYDYRIVANCDHSFSGHEQDLAEIISEC